MRYGAHCYIFTEAWSDQQLSLLDTARELGLDCFEIGVGDDVTFTPALTRRCAEAVGLELTISPGGAWPREYDLSNVDAKQRAQGLAWHKRQIDIGAALGATAYTGALYGHPGVLHYRRLQEQEVAWTAEGLHQLAEYGARHSVRVVIEPMSHFRTHVATNAAQAMQLVRLAAHPNLQMLLDTYHLVTETRDYAGEIEQAQSSLWGIHACESDRGAPGGGLAPWADVFRALRAIDFDGYVIFESYNSSIGNPPGDFAFRRGMLHNVCADGAAFVQTALRFMKAGFTNV
jgi:D-psicose/D-tagatose/L-ribulose 3-epimerase